MIKRSAVACVAALTLSFPLAAPAPTAGATPDLSCFWFGWICLT